MKPDDDRAGELSQIKVAAVKATDARDWTGALKIYTQGLALENLSVTDKIGLHQGKAACYHELGNHSAEAEELREANRLYQDQASSLFEQIQQRNAELAAINSIQDGLAARLDVRSIFELVGFQISEIFSGHSVSLYTYDPDTDMGEAMFILDKGKRYYPPPFRPGPIGKRAMELGQTLMLSTREEYEAIGAITVEGTRPSQSGIYAPLVVNNRMTGALNIENGDRANAFDEADVRLLTTIANAVSVGLENARLFDETHRLLEDSKQRSSELQIINNVQAGLVAKLDMKEIYELVGNQVKDIFDAEVVVINRFDIEKRLTYYEYAVEKGQRLAVEPQPFNPIIEDLIEKKQTFLVNEGFAELMAEADAPAVVAGEVPLSVLSVPLLNKGRVSGAISLQNVSKEHAFKASHVQLLETLAASLSVAIETARLFDETQRLFKAEQERVSELQIINSIQQGLASELDFQGIINLVGDRLQEVLQIGNISIIWADHENMMALPLYVSIEGQRVDKEPWKLRKPGKAFLKNKQPIVWGTAAHAAEMGLWTQEGDKVALSGIFMPIIVSDKVIGAIRLEHYERENAFDHSVVRLINTIANSMGVALENARLFDETQRLLSETTQRAAELAVINRVSNELVAEPNLAALIQVVGEQLKQIFNADIAYVALLDQETGEIQFPYQFGEFFSTLQLGEGLTSKVIETGEALLINQDGEQRRAKMGSRLLGRQALSYLGVPIFLGTRTIGVISVQSTQTEGLYTQDDVRLLSTIAANLSTAIRNANLFDAINYQKKYYEMIIANSPAAIVLLDEDLNVTGWNPAAERLFGYSQEEALGRNVDRLVANREDIYTDAVTTSRRDVLAGQPIISRRTRKDGTLVEVELMALPVSVDGRQTGFIAIYHDITELQRARREAVEANQAKSAFLANMSHELRTPLNAILGFTRIVRRKGDGLLPEKQLDNLDKVLASSEHLLGLINTVLDIAKIEAGRMDVQVGRFQIKPLLALVGTTTQPLIRQGVVKLRLDVQDNIPALQTDQDKLKQILLNLLSNAAKFTHAGSITVKARADSEQLVVSVADTGIGISPQALERVFEEFQQADTSTTREYGGTGLGLSISRGLAQLLGGELRAESQIGAGSTFTLTVPLIYGAQEPVQTGEAPVSRDTSEGAPQAAENAVLVIDDLPEAVELIRESLTDAGYRVIGVQDGTQGAQMAREIRPMAITLDIMMPNKDGWQVLHDLKSDPLTRHIPVIMATIVDKKVMGYQLGADDYLIKPLDPQDLLDSLARLTGKQPHSRVLVVDDDPNVVDMIRELLEDSPYLVDGASDGMQALDAIQAAPPDIVLLDLLMPKLDGFGVIEVLEGNPETRRIPIIILTAKTLTNQEAAALNESISAIIQKQGLRGEALVRQIEACLKKARRV